MLADLSHHAGNHPDFNFNSEYAELYRGIGLPDLMGSSFSDLHTLAEQAVLFDSRLRRWFCEQSVALNEYNTIEEFARSLS